MQFILEYNYLSAVGWTHDSFTVIIDESFDIPSTLMARHPKCYFSSHIRIHDVSNGISAGRYINHPRFILVPTLAIQV